ncbi:Asp23/Gls24 family envelope stress response protein [Gehongia tenuis]|uniref:Asp23/Gls24 family envelope stress response protein n=1 Tax=Gehongia tenuis TaxID=2763655 RepID=A0A926D4F9_9FIRM|nr:Asp23/Gls24 family envelope stress response protein [Gehongia tenuis]MBC8531162.1 Asp23/Gls24 family envelope stress response protein [Gehongia tenuis]
MTDQKPQTDIQIADVENKNGKIIFASDVIAIIAGLAATEVEGVAGMSGGLVSGMAELLGRKNLTKGVKVEVGNEETAVDLNMIFEYGYEIHTVAKNVQENVKRTIENMTGLRVVEVNVFVQGIYFEKEVKEPEPPRVK